MWVKDHQKSQDLNLVDEIMNDDSIRKALLSFGDYKSPGTDE